MAPISTPFARSASERSDALSPVSAQSKKTRLLSTRSWSRLSWAARAPCRRGCGRWRDLGEARDVVVERMEPGGGEDAGLAHGAADALLPLPGGLDEFGGAGEHGADRAAQTLAEVHPNGIEGCGVAGGVHARFDDRVEEPRAIHVHEQPVRPGRLAHCLDCLPAARSCRRPDSRSARPRRAASAEHSGSRREPHRLAAPARRRRPRRRGGAPWRLRAPPGRRLRT